MSVALAANAPTSFEIKSANLPLVALLLKSADLTRLSAEFAQRFGDMPDFFDHDPMVIDLSPLQQAEPGAGTDFAALLALLRSYRLNPIAVRGGDDTQMTQAVEAGLTPASDATLQRAAPAQSPEPIAPQPVAEPVAQPQPAPGALVIDKPLRSGQQVYARGRDLVVMAMVNPGAEVIADGHIHVYAPLRGKAIAGASGDREARLFCQRFDPELVSIAGLFRIADQIEADLIGQRVGIRIVDDTLVIDRLS